MKVPLPIDEVLGAVADALRRGPNLVLRAPPGAGKTTRVPQVLIDRGLIAKDRRVVMLQPRRVAARASARRIASERGGNVGDEVGYQIRFEDRTSRRTRIAILTEGLLTRKIQADPTLEEAGCVILDEFHERSIHADLTLAFLREVQRTVRPDLKIVVMSATLDVGPVARFLGDAPVVDAPGRTYPIDLRWAERGDDRAALDRVVPAVKRALRAEEGDDGGDILVFMPGAGEIRRAQTALGPLAGDRLDVVPLFGELDAAAQDRAIERGPRRKIVLATNVAETSLTIEGVTTVVDSGLVKVARHDPARGVDRLDTLRVSRASADQRAGRAGRTAPGRAFRVWTEAEHHRLEATEAPEISRIDLAPVALEVIAWSGADPRTFGWFEAPPLAALEGAVDLLRLLGAVEPAAYRLTPFGKSIHRLPLHPRIAALLAAAHAAGVSERGALVAALASERDVLRRASPDLVGASDLLLRVERFEELERARFASYVAEATGLDSERARGVARIRDRLLDLTERSLGRKGPTAKDEEPALLRAVLAGFPDRVAKRRAATGDRVVLATGRGARLSPDSVVKDAPMLVAIELEEPRRNAELHARIQTGTAAAAAGSESVVKIASAIEESWLPQASLQLEERLRWNADREAVEALEQVTYRELVLRERVDTQGGDPAEVAAFLAEQASRVIEKTLPIDDDAEALLGRIAFLRTAMPELELPAIDRGSLTALLPALCRNRRTFAELRKLDLSRAIREELGHAAMAAIDRNAPERIEVPTGSQIKLRYEGAGPPVLPVRLQELFGLVKSPRVANNRVAIKMELLAPNMRPVQVTQDLESFWRSTYQEVRKELRARYPKHSWPDDPYTAPPQRGPRRRK